MNLHDMIELALRMLPAWIVGWFMIYAVMRSQYRDLMRVNFKAVGKWILFLCGLTVYRFIVMKLTAPAELIASSKAVIWIPWQMTLTVFWEDAAHILPLLVLDRIIGDRKWLRPLVWIATAFMMFAFGLGHVYQGVFSAMFISCYIPFGFKRAKEIGLGSMMLCHVLYDLSTILLIQYIVRSIT